MKYELVCVKNDGYFYFVCNQECCCSDELELAFGHEGHACEVSIGDRNRLLVGLSFEAETAAELLHPVEEDCSFFREVRERAVVIQ